MVAKPKIAVQRPEIKKQLSDEEDMQITVTVTRPSIAKAKQPKQGTSRNSEPHQ